MAASNTDWLRKTKSFTSTTVGAGGLSSSGTSVPLEDTTDWPTDTAVTVVIDRVDAQGVPTPAKQEEITGVIVGSDLTNLLRGRSFTEAQAHSAGAIVELVVAGSMQNDMVTWALAYHQQDGSLRANAVTTVKIADSNITTSKIANGAVTSNKLAYDLLDGSSNATFQVTLPLTAPYIVGANIPHGLSYTPHVVGLVGLTSSTINLPLPWLSFSDPTDSHYELPQDMSVVINSVDSTNINVRAAIQSALGLSLMLGNDAASGKLYFKFYCYKYPDA